MYTWIPETATELEAAIDSKSITESLFLDFKEFGKRSDSENKDLAKAIAAFSINGGMLILGVGEDKIKQLFLKIPQDLSGWPERVSQIALNRVQPPVRVNCTRLVLNNDGHGYLVVQVPVSSNSPHMVDGRYYGRSDTTNYALPDISVREILARNESRRLDCFRLVVDEMNRDMMRLSAHEEARLFMVAQPVSADNELLLRVCHNRNLRTWANELIGSPVFTIKSPYQPNFSNLSQLNRRAFGVARSTSNVTPDRKISPDAQKSKSRKKIYAADLEIREDGGLRLYYSRVGDTLPESEIKVLLVAAVAGMASRVIEMSRYVSTKTNWNGPWSFGISLKNLQGLHSNKNTMDASSSNHPFSEDRYIETCEVDPIELRQTGSPILVKLLGRLFRAIHDGSDNFSDFDEFPK